MTKSKYTRLQLAEQAQRVGATFLGLLCDDVERLYALELHMMKEDIEHGWRCFYGQEVGLEKHLPPPLVNESGKVWNLAALRQILIEGNTWTCQKFCVRGQNS